MKHAIFGYGVVGKALHEVLREIDGDEIRVFDVKHDDLDSLAEATAASVWWVCVPTDGKHDGTLDLTRVRGILATAAETSHRPLVIVKSTLGLAALSMFGAYERWAFSPEFLIESNPTMRNPSRLVVGAATGHVLAEATQVCAAVPAWKNAPLVQCHTNEAILIKLASNAMLALRVEAANEIADLCGREGLDYDTVRLGISLDKRIGGAHLLVPGPDGSRGFGGKCLPKDTAELASHGLELFRVAVECNKLRRAPAASRAPAPISRTRAAE